MPVLRIGVLALILAGAAQANDEKSSTDALNRGQQISTAMAAVTSTAISPLLGVCLLGIYDYTRTPADARATLPFYSKPHFWIPISALLLLIFFKDTIGGTIPLLKKPLDAVEILIINKASLVLLAFPVMFHQVAKLTGMRDISELIQPVAYAAAPDMLQRAGDVGAWILLLTAGTIITLVVWVVGHAADVLALVSPIPYLDLVVKVSRAAVLVAVATSAVLNPKLGLIASGIVILVCALLFWMALRLLILGTVVAWDVIESVFLSKKTTVAITDPVRAFTIGKIRGMPRHTLGKLTRDPNGILEFRYRRAGFGPTRRIRLEDASEYDVGRGILYPCVVLMKAEPPIQFRLLPRYRGSEKAVQEALGFAGVRDVGLKGLSGRVRSAFEG